jgi:hypothetical protein
MAELKTYILELENNKWFIHLSKSPETVNIECEFLFDFVKHHKPTGIFEIVDINEVLAVNTIVKRYMKEYGIDNVRGGSFTEEFLPTHIKQALEFELADSSEKHSETCEFFQMIYKKYSAFTKEDIEEELRKIKEEHTKYITVKNKYIQLKYSNYGIINRDILMDIDWLRNTYRLSTNETNYNLDLQKYHNVILKLNAIIETYYLLDEDSIKVEYDNLFKTPQYVFDYFKEREEDFQYFMSKIEYMTYTLINKIDEFEYDLLKFPRTYEKMQKYILQYLREKLYHITS